MPSQSAEITPQEVFQGDEVSQWVRVAGDAGQFIFHTILRPHHEELLGVSELTMCQILQMGLEEGAPALVSGGEQQCQAVEDWGEVHLCEWDPEVARGPLCVLGPGIAIVAGQDESDGLIAKDLSGDGQSDRRAKVTAKFHDGSLGGESFSLPCYPLDNGIQVFLSVLIHAWGL